MGGSPIEARISFRNDTETVRGFKWPILVDEENDERMEAVSLARLDPMCLSVYYEDESSVHIETSGGVDMETLLRTVRLIEE